MERPDKNAGRDLDLVFICGWFSTLMADFTAPALGSSHHR